MTHRHILIFIGLVVIGLIILLAWDFYKIKYSDDIDRGSKSYKDAYRRIQYDLTKNGLDFHYPPLADEYGAPTVELMLAKEYGFTYLNFPCIVEDQNNDAGIAEGYWEFFSKKYGDDFIKNAEAKAALIDKEFNVQFYRDSLEIIANRHFNKSWTADSIEIGEFNLEWTANIPFVLLFDSIYNANYSTFSRQNNVLQFTANSPYSDEKVKKLPTLAFTVYWKDEVKYPYKDIPFLRIYLNSDRIQTE